MIILVCVFFFKQKTAYEMRISDWSSDVCSSDLLGTGTRRQRAAGDAVVAAAGHDGVLAGRGVAAVVGKGVVLHRGVAARGIAAGGVAGDHVAERSEEHTSELQSLMRISYAVFCLKKKH